MDEYALALVIEELAILDRILFSSQPQTCWWKLSPCLRARMAS